MNERATDLTLAAGLATLPLLPTGPYHLGLGPLPWTEGVLVFLISLLCVTPNARIGRAPAPIGTMSLTSVASVVALFFVAVTGGALIGLAQDNVLMSSAFLANLREAPVWLFVPFLPLVNPLHALRVWLTFVEGPAAFLLVVIICRRASDPRRRGRWALGGAMVGLSAVSAFAVFQYIARFHLLPYWSRSNLVRTQSTFEDPNGLGAYLVLGIGVAVAVALRERAVRPEGWRLSLTVGAGLLAVAALGTTVSRTAWAAFAMAVIFMTAYGPRWDFAAAEDGWAPAVRRSARRGVAVLGVLFVIWLGARVWLSGNAEYQPTSPFEAVVQTVDPRVPLAEVLKGRQGFWLAAFEMARTRPITGVGLGRYPRLIENYMYVPRPGGENAHNFFLQLLAEIGVVGLLTFLVIVGIVAWAFRQAARTGGAEAGLAWGLLLGWVGFVITLMAQHQLVMPSAQLVVGTTLAAGLTATFTPPLNPRPTWFRRPAIVTATAVMMLVYGVAVSKARWVDSGDPYGYTWGLYGLEQDQAKSPFRRTGSEALLYVPLGRTDVLTLQFAAFPPPDGGSTTVTFSAEGQRASVICTDGSWQQVSMQIDRAAAPLRAIEIRLDVDRGVVPATLGESRDVRELGVMLRPPKFSPPREALAK